MSNELTKPFQVGPRGSALHQRIAQAKALEKQAEQNATSLPNRIALVLDCSGSMSGESIELLKQAGQQFLNSTNPTDTSVCLQTFGLRPEVTRNLTTIKQVLQGDIAKLEASDGTPMAEGLKQVSEDNPITRAVLVSDGAPDSAIAVYEACKEYQEKKIPVDTVHIGSSTNGEEVLRKVAELTGGIYMKFKDIHMFVQSFKYLTPALRGFLMSGDAAGRIGADDVKT
jgi:Mg-chelatase subunit ChlD